MISKKLKQAANSRAKKTRNARPATDAFVEEWSNLAPIRDENTALPGGL
jgi:hypothetical protein